MRRMLAVAAFALLPFAANAQSCGSYCTTGGSWNSIVCCSNSIVYSCGNQCDDAPTFTTIHHWMLTKQGRWELEDTLMAITFSADDKKYHLLWDSKEVDVAPDLRAMQQKGVDRMKDFQKSGFPLK